MNHIELFAGCGGFTLGLELAGYDLLLANELSPMASETFAYNFYNEDLADLAEKGLQASSVFWISSAYQKLKERLQENPFEYPDLSDGFTDIPSDLSAIRGKLLVGNIIQLNQLLLNNKPLLRELKTGFGDGRVDLVSGGPPCQSFSLAGLREKDSDKNSLPMEFAEFVSLVEPKFVLLENVTGILRAFMENGVRYHAWFEIAQAFALKGYYPLCLHINARFAGVPQNRPRFLMLGVHKKYYRKLRETFNNAEHALFAPAELLFSRVNQRKDIIVEEFKYFDVSKEGDRELLRGSFVNVLISNKEVSVGEALDDLKFCNPSRKSTFVRGLNKKFKTVLARTKKISNHEPRKNSEHIQRRFKIYQIIQAKGRQTRKEILGVMKGTAESIGEAAWNEVRSEKFLQKNGKLVRFERSAYLDAYLKEHHTKKHTQKALVKLEPAAAALSIPDDVCHYDADELRTLTVREMARIQSFPDMFTFRSKVTTGQKRRRFQVPQYTQVGNAVPPLLGFAIGEMIEVLNKRLTIKRLGLRYRLIRFLQRWIDKLD